MVLIPITTQNEPIYNSNFFTCLISLPTEVSPARWKNRTQKSCSDRHTGSSSLKILSMICKQNATIYTYSI